MGKLEKLPADGRDTASVMGDARSAESGRFTPSWIGMLQVPYDAKRAEESFTPAAADARMDHLRRILRNVVVGSSVSEDLRESTLGFEVTRDLIEPAHTDASRMLRIDALLVQADVLRRQGNREAMLRILNEAFVLCREADRGVPPPGCSPEMMSYLCAEALDAGIETNTVQSVIKRYRLPSVGPHVLNWPWPIRIYTLGRFSLVKDGAPVVFAGKAPRRLLELLQALIALGGREVHTSALMQAVWRDESSADLRKLFDNTLHRLRKILGGEDALILRDGKLTLDSRRCWVDAWAFERLARQRIDGLAGPAPLLERVVKLYQGHFLERDAEQPWILNYRDRLRSRFHRLVLTEGARLEGAGRWKEAADVYERGLEIDNLDERFYQRLMVCHRECREYASVIRDYRRCCELLSIVLGVHPSPETEAIRRSLDHQ